MAASREERMQQRMRGAQRHQVQDASFDLFLSLPDAQDAAAAAPLEAAAPPETTTTTTTASPRPAAAAVRTTPNTSAKRRRLNDGGSAAGGAAELDGTAARAVPRSAPRSTPRSAASLIARHVVGEEEIGESPVDAPGSGRRRSVVVSAAAASRSAALQQMVSNTGGAGSQRQRAMATMGTNLQRQVPSSSPPPPRRAFHTRSVSANTNTSNIDAPADAGGLDELSPELAAMVEVPSSGGGVGMAAAAPDAEDTTAAARRTQGRAGGVFSKLANAKRNASAAGAAVVAQRRLSGESAAEQHGIDDAVDELSSPSFAAVLEPIDNITTTSGMIPSSSPLARKSTAGARAARASRLSGNSRSSLGAQAATSATPAAVGKENAEVDDHDELSPDQPAAVPQQQLPSASQAPRIQRASEVPSSSPVSRPTKRMPLQAMPPTSSPRQRSTQPRKGRPAAKSKPAAVSTVEEEEGEEEEEQAEQIDVLEAARTIGRKRPRRSAVHEPSPELGSDPKQAEPATAEKAVPAARRRQRQQHLQEQNPSTQNQPRPPKSKGGKRVSSAPQPTKKPARRKRRRDDDENDSQEDMEGVGKASRSRGAPVPITVQRFTRVRTSRTTSGGDGGSGDDDDDDDDDDELAAAGADLPFANRSGVNAVDVLAQICEDIVEQKLQEIHEKHHQARLAAEDNGSSAAAARKDALVARRALESFQQELRTRLLEQAVAVDTLHALRKRVRAAHKEKLALREEILRIRAERDQVGLRMDALRMQHQAGVDKAMKNAHLSAAMHDIDLAVEQGRAAPELTAAQQKTAELANLELVVRRIAEQVSGGGSSGGGGTLQQIMEFNAFLERTAAVLEGRKLPGKIAAS